MATSVRSKNPNYNLQFIRDLYDKMFPSAKDYIKFLREEINQCHNKNSNGIVNKILKSTKMEKKYDEKKRRGRRSTILTSTSGVSEELELAKKTLLGG